MSSRGSLYGIGGTNMAAAGVRLLHGTENLETLGFKAAFVSWRRHVKMVRRIKRDLQRLKPKTFIAVAYPGLNLLLIPYAKKIGCEVCYLMPPQAWAWGGFRVNLVARWTDYVITVFPFEREFYAQRGVRVHYWKNPLQEHVSRYERVDEHPRIGLMPGSRTSEVRRNVTILEEYCARVATRFPGIQQSFILHSPCMYRRDRTVHTILQRLQRSYPNTFQVYTEDHYQHMKNCSVLITCSGTASLEAWFMQIPQVFFNRCTWFDDRFVRPLLPLQEYNLVNLLTGKKTVAACVSSSPHIILDFLMAQDIREYIN
jgi:lipid-A-disaccharide synthase